MERGRGSDSSFRLSVEADAIAKHTLVKKQAIRKVELSEVESYVKQKDVIEMIDQISKTVTLPPEESFDF